MRGIVVPEPTEDFTADPVELFFDLAFVFAFAQLVAHLVHYPTWDGFGEFALLFAMVWLPWTQFTWSANAVSGNSRNVRAIFFLPRWSACPWQPRCSRHLMMAGSFLRLAPAPSL